MSPRPLKSPRPPVDTPWLTRDECLVYLHLGSTSALYRLINEHRLPHVRMGNKYMFHKARLDRWMESNGMSEVPSGIRRVR